MNDDCTCRATDGFALVDVLVALTIAGLCASIMLGLVSFAVRMRGNLLRDSQLYEDVASIDNVLRILTEEPLSNSDSRSAAAYGTSTEFSITSLGPRILFPQRPTVFRIEQDAAAGRHRIILAWRPSLRGPERREELSTVFKSASFSYFGRRYGSKVETWEDAWASDQGVLRAVKVTLHSDLRKQPFDLVAPIRSDVPVDCLRQPHRPICLERQR